MKKLLFLVIGIVSMANGLIAQKYITKEGEIKIFSETSLFTIEAKNPKVASILNRENGEIVVSTLVRSFKFHEALVEEHFNENYMESHKFPKSVFKGAIENIEAIDFTKNGTYPIKIKGNLTMHGQTNPIVSHGEIIIKDDKIEATTEFTVSLSQFKIEVEESYKDRIADNIKLNVLFNYNKYNK